MMRRMWSFLFLWPQEFNCKIIPSNENLSEMEKTWFVLWSPVSKLFFDKEDFINFQEHYIEVIQSLKKFFWTLPE